ncbi:MAG: DegT/DnrJ/EryC1/StrS family aminotransferase [Pseudomonadota bacterium]
MTAPRLEDIIKGIDPLDKFVPFSPPLVGEEEIREVVDTLTSGWLTTGPKTERFEKQVADYCGGGKALAVNSCTTALHLALAVLGVGEEDGVITTPYTFASTGHVIMYQRARPFLVDVEPTTFNIDPVKVRDFLEQECVPGKNGGPPRHKQTGRTIKALLPVHYGGHPCRLDELLAIAREYGLFTVEDAAHAIGATYNGRKIGLFGDITCFSFYATKNITTGEGGLALTEREDLSDRMRVMSMYGISDARRIWARYAPKGSWVYDVAELGFKYNMMDIQAALGLHQLAKLDEFLRRRRENAGIYLDILGGREQVRTPIQESYAESAWHLFPILLNPDRLRINRDDFIEALKALNIGTSVLFIPLHFHSYYNRALGYGEGDFPIAEDLFRRVVNLPLSPAVPPETIARVARTAAKLLEAAS